MLLHIGHSLSFIKKIKLNVRLISFVLEKRKKEVYGIGNILQIREPMHIESSNVSVRLAANRVTPRDVH
ncbi:MAG: hypothetical protein OEX98_02630 [Nitrosopumilus sp.]|nr:hypothetical protein [Nitrosopumilus sp.]